MVKDHLWFFGAGRDFSLSEEAQTDITNVSYPTTEEETRLEAKLTVSPTASHSLIGSYLEIDRNRTNTDFGTILDLRSLNPNRADPQEITSANYTGILSKSFFVEAQWSERDLTIGVGSGGPRDLIDGTLIRTRGEGFRYWSPTFCGECEDELRNNENVLVKGSYFLSSEKVGSHDVVFGYDTFEDIRFAINHQTGSDFTVYGSDVVRDAAGNPVIGPASGSAVPIFDPDAAATPWVRWFAVFNEDLARPTSFVTNSFYVNDAWQLNDKWSFNLGARYDSNDGVDSAGQVVSKDDKISPRLGASYDFSGDGDLVLRASWGSYVAGIANAVADDASSGGAIGSLRWEYGGPPLNVGCVVGVDCLTADEVLREVFGWYQGLGGVLDLGQIDPNAPISAFQIENDVPGATLQIAGGIVSPSVEEFTLGVSKRLGARGLLRADAVVREWDDFYGERTDVDTGKVDTSTGPADVTLLGNFASGVEREYRGLITQLRYRVSDRVAVAANYTLSNTEGNFLGETSNSGPVTALVEHYPQYREARWNYPSGDLRVDQRHTLRAWATYDVLDNERHDLTVSWLENYFSGQPYGATADVDPRPFVENPGFANPPSAVLYHFTARDAFSTDDIHRSDVALNYSFRWKALGRDLEVFIQPEVINVFGEDGVVDPQGLDDGEGVRLLRSFDPFIETPIEGVYWEKRSTFGQPLNQDDFQTPRTFRLSVGFRFWSRARSP